jgi:ComEC/Rec2-related protein
MRKGTLLHGLHFLIASGALRSKLYGEPLPSTSVFLPSLITHALIPHPQRAPFVWILFPWIIGILAAPRCPGTWILPMGLTAFPLLALATLFPREHAARPHIQWMCWAVCFVCGSTLASAAWHRQQLSPTGAHAPLAPRIAREWEGRLRLLQWESETMPDTMVLRFLAEIQSSSTATGSALEGLRVRCHLRSEVPHHLLCPGSVLRVKAVLKDQRHLGDPIPFLFQGSIRAIIEGAAETPEASLRNRLRQRVLRGFEAGLPAGSRYPAMMRSIVTGDKSALKASERRRFQEAGVLHFMAISGFHLAALAGICLLIFKPLPLRLNLIRAAVTLAISAGFVWFTGNPVSALRALLMLGLFLAAPLFKRKKQAMAAVFAAAWILLLDDPGQLFRIGFQLSFVVVIALIAHSAQLDAWLWDRWPKRILTLSPVPLVTPHPAGDAILRSIQSALCVSWTAFWSSAPLIALHFSLIPFGSILTNALLGPVFAAVFFAGLASSLCALAGALPLCALINRFSALGLSWIDAAVHGPLALKAWIWKPACDPQILITGWLIQFLILLFPNAHDKGASWVFAAFPLTTLSCIWVASW